MVGYGQRVTVLLVAKHELAFEVGAPKGIRTTTLGQRRAFSPRSRSLHASNQAMTIQYRVDRAAGRHLNAVWQLLKSRSRSLRAPQLGFSLFEATIMASICGGKLLA